MKKLLFGWVGKKITEITLIDYIVFSIEFSVFIILLAFLIGLIVCIIDDIKFKKEMGIK